MAFIPVILLIICYSVWLIIAKIKKDLSILKTRAISSLVILLFFVHPNIVQFLFGLFNCYDVDGDMRLKNDLNIICGVKSH